MGNRFKEISLVFTAIAFIFGGLGIFLNYTNGIMLLGIICIGIGAGIFAIVIKGYKRNN